jgi:hypothetical protein
MVFKDWSAVLEANIMPNPAIVLSNVLEISLYPTHLTYYSHALNSGV